MTLCRFKKGFDIILKLFVSFIKIIYGAGIDNAL